MDKTILDGILLAYAASPSPQLAKMIALAYLDSDTPTEAFAYTSAMNTDTTLDELSQLIEASVKHNITSTLLPLLNQSQHSPNSIFDYLIQKNKKQEAQQVFTIWSEQNSEVARIDITPKLRLDIDTSETNQSSNPKAKPKLRVIEKSNIADISDLTHYQEPTTNFDDVVGLSEIKNQIHKKIILPFQKPSLFQRFKKKVGGGVLLYGPPGCGKTLLARATAGQCNANFYNIAVSDVLDMYIGESEQKLHAIFEKARANTPSVIFFDEFEALAGKREHSRNNATSNTVSQFLTELDGFTQNNQGVLILASTNVPWDIDTAFLRPGRFDRMFFVPPPDKEARQAILAHHIRDRPAQKTIDFSLLANRTSGFSGADMAHLVESAADEAIDESLTHGKDVNISLDHLKAALSHCRPTTIEWLTTARNYARYANDGGRYNDVLAFLKKHGK